MFFFQEETYSEISSSEDTSLTPLEDAILRCFFEQTHYQDERTEATSAKFALEKGTHSHSEKKRIFRIEKERRRKSYHCPYNLCGKKYMNKNILQRHLALHALETAYQCQVPNCGKIYKSKENLVLHHKNIHLHIKPFTCKFCTAVFSHRNGRIYHERKAHKDKLGEWSSQ